MRTGSAKILCGPWPNLSIARPEPIVRPGEDRRQCSGCEYGAFKSFRSFTNSVSNASLSFQRPRPLGDCEKQRDLPANGRDNIAVELGEPARWEGGEAIGGAGKHPRNRAGGIGIPALIDGSDDAIGKQVRAEVEVEHGLHRIADKA